MSSPQKPCEFTEDELELIEELVTHFGDKWIQTKVEQRLLESILEKIDRHLNG